MRRSVFFAIFLSVVFVPACLAQSSDSSSAPSQTSGASPDSPSADGKLAPAPDTKKVKKVWTNDNLSDAHGSVSVVGTKNAGKAGPVNAKPADAQTIANYKKQIQKLQSQIDDADKQLAKLKEFSEGEPVGTADRELHKGYNMQPIQQQITQLEAKKKEYQSKIDAILDEARIKGIEPGALR